MYAQTTLRAYAEDLMGMPESPYGHTQKQKHKMHNGVGSGVHSVCTQASVFQGYNIDKRNCEH